MTRLLLLLLVGCDRLGPQVEDLTADGSTPPPDSPPPVEGTKFILPAGAEVPHAADNAGMLAQIRLNDGLSDSALETAGGVLVRSVGKSNGATVNFWNFGTARVAGNFALASPVYVLVEPDGVTPIAHPMVLDSIPGDDSYSQVRRIVLVPITSTYAGELLTRIEAIGEAFELGLIAEPIAAGTWRTLPVVPPDTKLEVGGGVDPISPTEVYAAGHLVPAFFLGGDFALQPLRNGSVPIGQEARLISGVATGTPPVMPTTADAVPVFQYAIPTAPPTTAPTYTPLAAQVDVKLATGVAPAAITSDTQLFRRSPATGSINGFLTDSVASFTITTTVTLRQLQFQEGQP